MPRTFARIAGTTLLALLFAAPCAGVLAADKITTIPVQFAQGKTDTTVKGSFKGDDTVEYRLTAQAGQTLSVTVSGSSNADINVLPPAGYVIGDGSRLAFATESTYAKDRKSHTESVRLPTSGEYRIQVYQPRVSARRGSVVKYSLKIGLR